MYRKLWNLNFEHHRCLNCTEFLNYKNESVKCNLYSSCGCAKMMMCCKINEKQASFCVYVNHKQNYEAKNKQIILLNGVHGITIAGRRVQQLEGYPQAYERAQQQEPLKGCTIWPYFTCGGFHMRYLYFYQVCLLSVILCLALNANRHSTQAIITIYSLHIQRKRPVSC